MTLKQLAAILPGYVVLKVHSDTAAWSVVAGAVGNKGDWAESEVISATPFAPYTLEVSIKTKEATT